VFGECADQSGCRLLREQVPKIVVQLTVALGGAQVFMPQLLLHEHKRIADALGAEILVESGSVGATEAVRRELVLNWQARRDPVARSVGLDSAAASSAGRRTQ
jgi:hypothetical protein